jgi:hypothetical protein
MILVNPPDLPIHKIKKVLIAVAVLQLVQVALFCWVIFHHG